MQTQTVFQFKETSQAPEPFKIPELLKYQRPALKRPKRRELSPARTNYSSRAETMTSSNRFAPQKDLIGYSGSPLARTTFNTPPQLARKMTRNEELDRTQTPLFQKPTSSLRHGDALLSPFSVKPAGENEKTQPNVSI